MKYVLISVAALIGLVVGGAIGYEIGHHHSTSPKSAHGGAGKGALTGVYTNGASGSPHYFITLKENGKGKVKGTVSYAYQDGQTQAVLTFTGKAQDGTATLTPTVVTGSSGTASESAVPSAISMTYNQSGIALGECTSYLHLAPSESACSFTPSSSTS